MVVVDDVVVVVDLIDRGPPPSSPPSFVSTPSLYPTILTLTLASFLPLASASGD